MAGYSGTPLPKKVGIKDGSAWQRWVSACARVALVGAPDGFARTMGTLPPGVDVRTQVRGRFDVLVVF